MTKISGQYSGDLRNVLLHEGNQNQMETDAPLDNNGKGARFSPTDLIAAGLGSCMLTIIGIRANAKRISIGHPSYKIEKTMQSNPRKIERVKVQIYFDIDLKKEDRDYLETEAKNCPVALSLSSELIQEIEFNYA